MNLDSHALGVLYATFASLAWVIFSFTMKTALRGAPVLRAAAAVNGMNAVFVTIIALFFVPPAAFIPARSESLIYLALAGLLHIGLARIFFYTAIQRLGPNRALPLAMSYPIVTAAAAAYMLGESVSVRIFIGLIFLLAGITLIVRAAPPGESREESSSASWRLLGWGSAVVTSLLWGIAAVFFKKAALEIPPIVVAAGVLWVGFAVTFLLSRGMEPHAKLTSQTLRWLAISAALQAIAIPFYTLAFTLTLAVRVTAIISAQPLFAIPIAWLFMRESENIIPRLIAGAALTVGGTILVIV
jgi:drug/metabolite transporter (DMT)-like permease